MIIFDSKGKKIQISNNDFMAEGGEGRLYADKSYVYKIYLDEQKVIPTDKMSELSRLDKPNIIKPVHSLYDSQHKRIGYSMARVNNPVPLARDLPVHFGHRIM